MLTHPYCCIQVALSVNRFNLLLRYSTRQILATPRLGFHRVLLADSKHKGHLLGTLTKRPSVLFMAKHRQRLPRVITCSLFAKNEQFETVHP